MSKHVEMRAFLKNYTAVLNNLKNYSENINILKLKIKLACFVEIWGIPFSQAPIHPMSNNGKIQKSFYRWNSLV